VSIEKNIERGDRHKARICKKKVYAAPSINRLGSVQDKTKGKNAPGGDIGLFYES